MDEIDDTIRKAQAVNVDQGPSNPLPASKIQESQEEGTTIEVSSAPTFGFDYFDLNEVNQPNPSDDDLMMFDEEEESSGFQHSTSKPKEKKKKKKKMAVSRFFESIIQSRSNS